MRPQELNLLVIFDAIMTERSITRAADRLALTQPAVSNAVSRMRVIWKDELFVKDGRNIQPTSYAQNLWGQVREPLQRVSEAVDDQAFDPATAKRTFRVTLADTAVDIAWGPMRRLIEQDAPGINIHAMPYTIINANEVLEGDKVDLVIGVSDTNPAIVSEFLFNPMYVCVMRKEHPLSRGRLTMKKFAAAEHLLVSLSGDTVGFSDQVLAQQGLSRRIACTVNHFNAVAPLVKETNLIAVVPCGPVECAIARHELHVTKPPFEMPPAPVSMFWHRRQDQDNGLIWFRQIIKELFVTEAERQNKSVCMMMDECREYWKSRGHSKVASLSK